MQQQLVIFFQGIHRINLIELIMSSIQFSPIFTNGLSAAYNFHNYNIRTVFVAKTLFLLHTYRSPQCKYTQFPLSFFDVFWQSWQSRPQKSPCQGSHWCRGTVGSVVGLQVRRGTGSGTTMSRSVWTVTIESMAISGSETGGAYHPYGLYKAISLIWKDAPIWYSKSIGRILKFPRIEMSGCPHNHFPRSAFRPPAETMKLW